MLHLGNFIYLIFFNLTCVHGPYGFCLFLVFIIIFSSNKNKHKRLLLLSKKTPETYLLAAYSGKIAYMGISIQLFHAELSTNKALTIIGPYHSYVEW